MEMKLSSIPKIRWFYLVLGVFLLFLSMLHADLYYDSDINGVQFFPFSFGLIFLLFFYLMGTKSRELIKWGIICSIIIILAVGLTISYDTNGFGTGPYDDFNLAGGVSNALSLLIFGSVVVYFGFLYMWLPYIAAIFILGKKFKNLKN